ncbi:MAG: hypothetical protein C0200_07625 [Thermoproteota archaeon]|nr:MAG: hypothetical protein C0200_07625 [Candidatus Korarchaeota archaeon]
MREEKTIDDPVIEIKYISRDSSPLRIPPMKKDTVPTIIASGIDRMRRAKAFCLARCPLEIGRR